MLRSGKSYKNNMETNDLLKSLVERFDRMEARFDEVDQRLQTVERNQRRTRSPALPSPPVRDRREDQRYNFDRRPRRIHIRDDSDGDDSEVDHPRRRDRRDRDEHVYKHVKVEAPSFDGRHDPHAFSDWVLGMDHYFDWHRMREDTRVRFAKLKLTGPARIYWSTIERKLERANKPPIETWDEMKEYLEEKYLPTMYEDHIMDELHKLRQGNMTVHEYMTKFDELMIRGNLAENSKVTLSRFRSGLREDIQRELLPHRLDSLEQAFQLAQDLERYLKVPQYKKSYQAGEQATKPGNSNPSPSHVVTKVDKGKAPMEETSKKVPSGVKCFNCQGVGHYAFQCPSKSLHIDKVVEEEEHVNVHIPEAGQSDAEDALGDTDNACCTLLHKSNHESLNTIESHLIAYPPNHASPLLNLHEVHKVGMVMVFYEQFRNSANMNLIRQKFDLDNEIHVGIFNYDHDFEVFKVVKDVGSHPLPVDKVISFSGGELSWSQNFNFPTIKPLLQHEDFKQQGQEYGDPRSEEDKANGKDDHEEAHVPQRPNLQNRQFDPGGVKLPLHHSSVMNHSSRGV